MAAGRARIDYNHPMAGRSLKYDYKIIKVIKDKVEKVKALLESNTGHEGFEVSFDGNDISIITPVTRRRSDGALRNTPTTLRRS